MQQDFAELTIAAVNSLYGELSSLVYASLAYAGRRTIQEIVKSTRFSTRQVGASLVVLIQHLLVKYHTTDLGQTFYQADGEAAYNSVFRFQKLVKAIDNLLGKCASTVVQEIALHGHATVYQLQNALCRHEQVQAKVNGKKHRRNGDLVHEQPSKDDVQPAMSQQEFQSVFRQLLEAGYLVLVTPQQFLPREDLINEAKRTTLRDLYGKGLTTAKDKQAFASDVNNLLGQWHDEAYTFMGPGKAKRDALLAISANGINGTNSNSSAQVKVGSFVVFRCHGANTIQHGVIVRLNFEKCSVILRDDQLANYVHRYIGETTSLIFRGLLQALESRIMKCYHESDSKKAKDLAKVPWPTPATILQFIPPGVDLQHGLAKTVQSNGVNGHSSKSSIQVISDDSDSDTDVDNPKKPLHKQTPKASTPPITLVEQHLRLLEQDPRGFVQQIESGWSVPYAHVTGLMIQYEVENTIAAQHGQLASRIIRILHKNSSNDEKGLAIAAVIKPKDVRSLTNTLLSAGIITTQEIPRDTNRTTNRLLWLYAYSADRARLQILNDSYRAMVRFLHRLLFDKSDYSGTIDKAERTDVVGHEDEYLNERDRDLLDQWSRKEEVILTQIARIDDLVACMRDFAPMSDLMSNHDTTQEDD